MYIDGFINIDIKDNVGVDLVCNCQDINKHFQPNSINLILTSHMLEHITYDEAIKTLSTYYSLLKSGGFLIVEVPDCENLDERLRKKEIDLEHYNDCKYGSQEFGQTHKNEYTRNSLYQLLSRVGFKDISENLNTSIRVSWGLCV